MFMEAVWAVLFMYAGAVAAGAVMVYYDGDVDGVPRWAKIPIAITIAAVMVPFAAALIATKTAREIYRTVAD